MLAGLLERREARSAEVDARLQMLEAKVAEADERLRRLYALVEDGQTELDDLLKARVASLKLDRQIAREALERAQGTRQRQILIDEPRIEAFGRLMRERLTTEDIPFRKAYLGAIIDRVEVDDGRIRIFGRKDVLEQAATSGSTGTCRFAVSYADGAPGRSVSTEQYQYVAGPSSWILSIEIQGTFQLVPSPTAGRGLRGRDDLAGDSSGGFVKLRCSMGWGFWTEDADAIATPESDQAFG